MLRPYLAELQKMRRRPSTWVMIAGVWLALLIAVAADHFTSPAGVPFWAAVANQSWTLFVIRFFAVVVAGGIVANEYAWGTIKLLLIRPHRRARILFAKYLAVVTFVAALMAFSLLALVLLNGLVMVFSRSAAGSIPAGPLATAGGVIAYYLLRLVEIMIYAGLAFMLSALTKSNAFAVGFGITAMLLGPVAGDVVKGAWTRYFLFSRADLAQYLIAGDYQGLWSALVVVGVYLAVFYVLARQVFIKRDVLE